MWATKEVQNGMIVNLGDGIPKLACNYIPKDKKPSDAMDIGELTRVNIEGRKKALITFEFMQKKMPGWEKSIIILSATQLGMQSGRRFVGDYTLSEMDMKSDEI